MKLNKKQGKFLTETIDHWLENSVISTDQAEKLKSSYSIRSFDWKKLAKYSFWIAIICGVISFGSIIADDILIDLMERLFTSSDIGVCIAFGIISTGIYYLT